MYWKSGFVIVLLLVIGYTLASDFTCGDLKSSNRNVCSRKGICVAQDVCLCDNNRGGLLCEKKLVDLVDPTNLNISNSYLDAPVPVVVDEYGIPHFEVLSEKDEMFAIGYYRASQRLWLYVWSRILVSGTASSIFGESLFPTDVNFRTYNYMKNAQDYYLSGNADPDVIEDLTHFTAGINAYITQTPASQYSPGLLMILRGLKPDLFLPYHIYAMERLGVSTLAGTVSLEIVRLKALLKGLSLDRVSQLYPAAYRNGETTIFDKEDMPANYVNETIDNSAAYVPPVQTNNLFQTRSLRQRLSKIQGPMMDVSNDPVLRKTMNFNEGASNEFALSKLITKGRESLLANDPHVGITAPSFWDVYHVKCVPCNKDIMGFAVAFSPYMFGGKNNHISFGFVAAYVDNNDVFRMVDGPTGGYMHNGQELQYNIRMENILVMVTNATTGLPYLQSRVIPIYDTVYGPLGNTLFGVFFSDKVAMKTLIAGTHVGASYLDGLRVIQTAKNFKEFLAGALKINSFGLNIAYTDKKGNSGVAVAAGIPNRKPGHTGMFVVPGDGTYDYDLIPNDLKPYVYNPAKGYTVACNNRILPVGHPMQRFMGLDTAVSYRGLRATDLLEQKLADEKVSAEYLRLVQVDTHSLLFEEYKPLFVSLLSSEIVEPAYMDAVNALVSFDGTYHKGDVAPALFEVVRFMSTQITTPEGGSPTFVPHAPPTLMLNGDSICALSAPFTDCNGYLYKLVKDATNLLMQNHGKLPQWGVDGNVGKLLAKNVPLSSIPTYAAASTIVTGPTGGTHTLNVAQPIVDAKASLHTEFGPSIRTLHLGKEKGTLLLSFPGGNSEFPTSPYYQNFAPFYQNGTYVPLSTDNYQAVDSALLI